MAALAVAVILLLVLRTCVVVWTPVNVFPASVLATVKLASGNVIVRAAVGQLNVSIWLIIGIIVLASGKVQVLDAVAVLLK